jgi:outer membrane protein OmpA-like peptidoglycan-associated protein
MMKWSVFSLAGLALTVSVVSGCAGNGVGEHSLQEAQTRYDSIKTDSDVLRSAPKDVQRAEETLSKAKQLSGYWGSQKDVRHFAYLSQRYSDIAREHATLQLTQEKVTQLELQSERLQLQLREKELRSVRERNEWLTDQLFSLGTTQTERGMVMTLGDMLFSPGHSRLNPSANETVLKLAQFLRINPKREIRIEGYTDDSGDDERNLTLSRQRAQSVAKTLTALGVDAGRLQVVGYGKDYPVASNASAEGRAKNRRVEVVFSDEEGNFAPAH